MAEPTLDLEIRLVDASSHQEMVEFQRVYEEAERAEFPDTTVYTLEDAITILTRPSQETIYRGWAAFEQGRMVGEGLVLAGRLDNLRRARLWSWVPPAERGRGIGSAITAAMIDNCRALGRDILYSAAMYPFDRRDDHPYRRFAERHGFVLANTQLEQRLEFPVDPGRLDDAAADAARSNAG